VQDQPVVRVQPERLRNDLFQFELDFEYILARGEAGSVAHPEDVRVHGEGFPVESRVENDVRRLPPDTRQLFQLLAPAGDLTVMIAYERFRQSDDVLGFGVEQADRLDRIAHPLFA